VYRVFVSDDMGMLDGLETGLHGRVERDLDVTREVVTDEDALIETAADADALVVGTATPVTDEVLRALDLDLVARGGVGVDNVDRDVAAERGTTVTNVPEYCTEEVASHAVSLAFACARRLPTYDRQTSAGGWDWNVDRTPRRLSSSTFGFVGFGAIARRAADVLSGVGADLLAFDPYVDEATAADHGADLVDFESLTAASHFLLVFAPLTPETRGLVDDEALDLLPTGAVVVNVGRGPVVDSAALADALAEGQVSAAGLDVLPTEPPEDRRLVERDDALVTPHAGWYSSEAQSELVDSVAESVAAVAADETPEPTVVE
jgi:D-3-phosphoglycerate dehydrogenase